MPMARPKDGMRRYFSAALELFAILALVAVSRTVLAQPFYVTSGSMEPTLQIGDQLLATKFAYGYSRYSLPLALGPASDQRLFGRLPARGDVVLFNLPRDPREIYVKRVVGLPGDRVQLRDGIVWINGRKASVRPDGTAPLQAEDGSEMPAPRFIETLPGGREHTIFKTQRGGRLDDTDAFVVPPAHLFVLGDNRDDSLDSRVPAWEGGVGFVPVENLIGRADIVLGSWNTATTQRPFWSWLSGFRVSRFFSTII